MMLSKDQRTLDAVFKHLFTLLRSRKFLDLDDGYGEVPFFICPFDPSLAQEIPERVSSLITGLKENGIKCLHVDLYSLCIEILKKSDTDDSDNTFKLISEQEKDLEKSDLADVFAEVLSPEHKLKPAIVKIIEDAPAYDLIMLSGVGEVYPYVRTHALLASLEAVIVNKPLVILFPGKYLVSPNSGASLELFGRLDNDRYYRATNILDCKI